MLSNLFGKKEDGNNESLFKDKVFLNNTAKINACIKLAKENMDILFLAWFTETAHVFKNAFLQSDLETNRIILVEHLQQDNLTNNIPVFIEHFPLNAIELSITANWNLTGIIVYSSMDEPLFKHFGSDKMIPLIKLLGFKESEPIEHSYVSQSIIKGQQKIADKVSTPLPAQSQEKWMEINLK